MYLDTLQNLLLELPLNLVALIISRRLPVEIQESAKVKLGRLEKLNLADVNLDGKVSFDSSGHAIYSPGH